MIRKSSLFLGDSLKKMLSNPRSSLGDSRWDTTRVMGSYVGETPVSLYISDHFIIGSSPPANPPRYREGRVNLERKWSLGSSLDTIQARLRLRPYQQYLRRRWLHCELYPILYIHSITKIHQDVLRDISASGEPSIPNIKDLLNPDAGQVNMNELWDVHLQKWNYQSEYLDKWRDLEDKLGKELDAIIAPITATAAVRHNQFRYYGYASVINLLDFTSVVVPVTFADKSVDLKKVDYQSLGQLDATVQAEYDPEAYDGAPVAVQIIGRRLSEEKTLAIAQEIGRLLGNAVTP